MTAHLIDSPRKSREPICKDSKLDVRSRGKGAIYSRNRKVRGGNLVCGDGVASFPGASVCPTQVGAKRFESLVTWLGQGERAQGPPPKPSPHRRHRGKVWALRCVPLLESATSMSAPQLLPRRSGDLQLPSPLPRTLSLSTRRKERRARGDVLAEQESQTDLSFQPIPGRASATV